MSSVRVVKLGRQPRQNFPTTTTQFLTRQTPTRSYRLWDEFMWDRRELREITLSRHGRRLTDGRTTHEFPLDSMTLHGDIRSRTSVSNGPPGEHPLLTTSIEVKSEDRLKEAVYLICPKLSTSSLRLLP